MEEQKAGRFTLAEDLERLQDCEATIRKSGHRVDQIVGEKIEAAKLALLRHDERVTPSRSAKNIAEASQNFNEANKAVEEAERNMEANAGATTRILSDRIFYHEQM